MSDDAQNVREEGSDGVAAGAGDAVVGGEPANDVSAAEAQGVVGGTPEGGTGEDGLVHEEDEEDALDEDDLDDEGADDTLENGPVEDTGALEDVEVAKYRITGLVDHFDEQNNIQGQFAVGSVQELPVEYGDRMVADGQAELVDNDDEVE